MSFPLFNAHPRSLFRLSAQNRLQTKILKQIELNLLDMPTYDHVHLHDHNFRERKIKLVT